MSCIERSFLGREYYLMNLHSKHTLEEIEIYLIKKKLAWLLSLNPDEKAQREDLFEALFGVRSQMERIRMHSAVLHQEQTTPGQVPKEISAPFPTVISWDGSGRSQND
jgi:hypothetical protein